MITKLQLRTISLRLYDQHNFDWSVLYFVILRVRKNIAINNKKIILKEKKFLIFIKILQNYAD